MLLILTSLLLLSACGERIEPGQTASEAAQVSGLKTIVTEPVPVPARYALPGTLESDDRGQLTARIPGQVARILVTKGQVVKRGDHIQIEFINENVKITAAGQARQSGGVGDRIKVENIGSNKVIVAEVVDEKSVRVLR